MPQEITLTEAQRKEMRRLARRAVGRVAERIQYVLLVSRGISPEAIAALYEVDVRTVGLWLTRFREAGLAGLDDLPRSGRPRVANAAAEAEATQCLEGSPSRFGWLRTTWTRALLGRHLGERLGSWLSRRSMTRLVRRLDFVWTRPKLTTRGQDPQAAEREQLIRATVAAYPQAPRLYEDECDVHLVPELRGQYQRRGQQQEIPTPGNNRKQAIFGFLNVRSGEWHFWLTPRKRSGDFLTCLHELYRYYPTGPILLFSDNASIHRSKVTRRWLANHPRFLVHYLPAYTGHQTNPVEKVWWALKGEYLANELYPSLEALQDAVYAFFATFSRERALRLTARHEREVAARTPEYARAA
jgi:transposase